jgi:hypothetical protein
MAAKTIIISLQPQFFLNYESIISIIVPSDLSCYHR